MARDQYLPDAAEDETDERPRGLIDAGWLADELGVPSSVLVYLEKRLPDIHAIAEGRRRLYRAADAALIAGCADLLYGEGRAFRDVAALLRAGKAQAIAKRGRRIIGAVAGEAEAAPARAIPPDAVVRHRGRPTAAATPSAPVDPASILAELIDCVRTLEAAR